MKMHLQVNAKLHLYLGQSALKALHLSGCNIVVYRVGRTADWTEGAKC